MTSPYFRPLDPQTPPDQITPRDTPSSPEGFASVTPHGRGPAPYDIQAPMADLTGAFDSANSIGGSGVLYAQGARQAAAQTLLESPAGFGLDGFDIQQGFSGGWPNDVEPPADYQTPDQGQMGTFPRMTGTD